MAIKSTELSLMELYNKLAQQQAIYGEKIESLYDIFSGTLKFPEDVTNSNDSPGLWPDTGINVYHILSEYNLAEKFCTSGVLFNIGQGRYKYQWMLVRDDELHPVKNGKLYYRYSKASENAWSGWKRCVYLYELVGGKDEDGNPYDDDFGDDLTDTEDVDPENNPHNKNSGDGSGDGSGSTGWNFVVQESETAKKIETPRKIELTDLIEGNAYFDGSEDIQISTSSSKVMPINVRLDATKNNNAKDQYRLICTLPVSGNTYDYAVITGHLGGFSISKGKCYFTICASNRDGATINGMILGKLVADVCDIVAVRNTKGELKIYLKTGINESLEDIKMSVYGSEQMVFNNIIDNSFSSSTKVYWRLSTGAVRFEGNNIYGNITGNVTGTASNAELANKAKQLFINHDDNKSGYLLAANDIGAYYDCFVDTNIKLNAQAGVLIATDFVGHLQGNADTCTTASYSEKIMAYEDNTALGYLIGVSGHTQQRPYYDSQVYLTKSAGTFYALNSTCSTGNASTSYTSPVFNVNGKIYMNANGNGRIYMHNGTIVWTGDDDTKRQLYLDNRQWLSYNGEITAQKVHNAIYNDYAEYFPRGGATEVGDVIALDLNADGEKYIKATEHSDCVVGVESNSYGHIVGGDDVSDEENLKNFIPVGLIGRVPVKFIGKAKKGGKVVATFNGCARLYNALTDEVTDIFGYLVEADDKTEQRLLKIKLSV